MQADPYRRSGRLDAPQSWNRYSYAHNEPVDNVDPLGLDPWPYYCPAWIQDCGTYVGTAGFSYGIAPLIGGGGGSPEGGWAWSPPQGRPSKPKVCHIAVAFRYLPDWDAYHAYIVTTEGEFPNDPADYFGGDRKGTRLVGNAGAYTPQVAGADFTLKRRPGFSYEKQGSCDRYNQLFAELAAALDNTFVTYNPLSTNSNALVYTALLRAGLRVPKIKEIQEEYGVGDIPGWGVFLPLLPL